MIPKASRIPVAALALLFIAAAGPAPAAATGAFDVAARPEPAWRAVSLASERGPIRRRQPGHGYGRPENFASIGVGRFDPLDQPGNGLYMSGAVGSEVAPRLDIGGQISWYHRSVGGSQFVYEYRDPAGNTRRVVQQAGSIDTDLVPVMGTLRVRFPASREIEPYVGGAIGFEWLTVEGADTQGNLFSDDYSGFGAQLLGGMNVRVSPEVALYGEAVWNASTLSAEFDDPFIGATIREEVDFDGVGFHAGLRFRF